MSYNDKWNHKVYQHMRKNCSSLLVKIFLSYLCILLLLSGYAMLNHLVFRQYFRTASGIIVFAGLIYLMILGRNRIPADKKLLRLGASALIGIIVCLTVLGYLFFGTDKESVVMIDGQKKIKVESSFIMYYEVSFYDYRNILWYKAYPRIVENYDDGDPGQWIYTDYYDENGVFVERRFKEE